MTLCVLPNNSGFSWLCPMSSPAWNPRNPALPAPASPVGPQLLGAPAGWECVAGPLRAGTNWAGVSGRHGRGVGNGGIGGAGPRGRPLLKAVTWCGARHVVWASREGGPVWAT